MRAFANNIMRGPVTAALFAGLGCVFPLTLWLGCATIALIILRKGLNQSLFICLSGFAGGIAGCYISGEITAPLAVITTMLAALGLRDKNSWQLALLIITCACIVNFQLLLQFSADYLQKLIDFYNHVGAQLQSNMAVKGKVLKTFVAQDVAAFMTLFIAYTCVLSLVLGRWWQAELFNPGGFGEEFKALRLHRGLAVLLLVGAAGAIYIQQAIWASIITLPLLIAGIALVHAYAMQRNLGRHWLIFFYTLLLLFGSSIGLTLTFIACADSQLNFRQRWQRPPQ